MHHSPQTDIQKLSKYKEEHFVKEVDNFLYTIEQYLLLMHLEEEKRYVNTAACYLVEDDLVLWRNRSFDEED